MKILYLFADRGVEAEALSTVGAVHRYTLNPDPTPFVDETTTMDLAEDEPDETADLVVAHPPCTRWSDMPDANKHGDAPDLIQRARELAQRLGDHYIVENKPGAPLHDPAVLHGKMFGLPIAYERAFETSFPVEHPPRQQTLPTETSSFFYSERTHRWWKAVKGVRGEYPKEHVAKNALPLAYVDCLTRSWLQYVGEAQGAADYSDYDARMDERRAREANSSLGDYVTDGGRNVSDNGGDDQ
jgi:hypothetical protein